MIINSDVVAIIADDLTGANDTALQFKLSGTDTNILLKNEIAQTSQSSSQAWAISTESRNVSPDLAFEKVKKAAELMVEKINPDFFYKKIDSTVRGNIAIEVLALLEVLDWDCGLILPAFPQEGRTTVGGYHLLKGVPIERTEMARDPHSPITESHLPTLLNKQLGEKFYDLVDTIELKTVLDGAGPVLLKLNELIAAGKKIIVADCVSTTDIEQITLAMQKSNYKILPVGTAATAKVLSSQWFNQNSKEQNEVFPVKLPVLPKFIVSGSATQITANQIDKLEQIEEYEEKCLFIKLDSNTILNGVTEELVDRIVSKLRGDNIVLVHTSNLVKDFNGITADSIHDNITKSEFANMITNFLAELTHRVLEKATAILITLGGETSFKCADAIGANQLTLIDEVLPAIALSKNVTSDQWIVTKSGNLGGVDTLVEILKYFEKHEG